MNSYYHHFIASLPICYQVYKYQKSALNFSSYTLQFTAVIMKVTNVLILVFIGLFCIVDVKAQTAPAAPFDWRQFIPKMPAGITAIIDAAFKLQTDVAQMRRANKYDGVLIKTDVQAIVKATEGNGFVIPAATKTKIDEFLAAIDKMIAENKYDPKIIREGVISILTSLRPFQNSFTTTAKPIAG